MKKEVIRVPLGKDFLQFMEEKFGRNICGSWIYIDKLTIEILSKRKSTVYNDTKGRLNIPYGNIVIEGYRFEDYSWYKIKSIKADNLEYEAGDDPKEIFFVKIH